jgi:hypothetical protein
MLDLAELEVCRIDLEYCSDHFPRQLCRPGDLNNDPTVWLDGTIQPHNHQIGLCHPLDGITIHKYKLLHFSTTNFFTERRRR